MTANFSKYALQVFLLAIGIECASIALLQRDLIGTLHGAALLPPFIAAFLTGLRVGYATERRLTWGHMRRLSTLLALCSLLVQAAVGCGFFLILDATNTAVEKIVSAEPFIYVAVAARWRLCVEACMCQAINAQEAAS